MKFATKSCNIIHHALSMLLHYLDCRNWLKVTACLTRPNFVESRASVVSPPMINTLTWLLTCGAVTGVFQELQTALHIAARQGDVDGVELLLERGAAPNVVTTDLNTPLHGAAREGHDNVAKVLIDHGANMALANKVRASVIHRSSCSNLNVNTQFIITFRVSRRQHEMYCGHASVCLCVCPRPHDHTIARTWM